MIDTEDSVSYIEEVNENIFEAIYNRQISDVNIFIQEGCDLEKRNLLGMTPLILAVECGSLEIVKLLVGSGANIKCRTPNNGGIFHYCHNQYIAEWLFDHIGESGQVFKIDDVNIADETPLHLAIKKRSHQMVIWLLEHGADMLSKDLLGHNSIDLCVHCPDIMDILKCYEHQHLFKGVYDNV